METMCIDQTALEIKHSNPGTLKTTVFGFFFFFRI